MLPTAQIQADLVTAMKEHNEARTAVLRLLKNALKNEEIKLRRDLTPDEETKILQKEAKQRRDSIEAYKQGNRDDLAAAEQSELEIIALYLPTQMDETALYLIIDRVIDELDSPTAAQMGVIIGKVMAQVAGQADGGTVSRLVRAKLQ